MKSIEVDCINYRVLQKLLQRAAAGRAEYGVTMDRDDLRLVDWLKHLQEEMLDACVYLEKVLALSEEENSHSKE